MIKIYKNKKKAGLCFLMLCFCSMLMIMASASAEKNDRGKLIFEQVKSMRASFCLYSDGKFYLSMPAGCSGQFLSWGHWENVQDTTLLSLDTLDIFDYEVIRSSDSISKFQIVRIIDCYDQPVRFQNVNVDTGYTNLYNVGMIRVKKGNSINYPYPIFSYRRDFLSENIMSNSDTITYKWHCNREILESINGGSQTANYQKQFVKVILKGKEVEYLSK